MIYDTTLLENAYRKFGNVAWVDKWFEADCFKADPVRNADHVGKVVSVTKNTGKPLWYLPVVQIEYRPMERLNMNKKLECTLVSCNERHPDIYPWPATASDLEKIARKKYKKDWRVEFISAFESLTYQRQGRNKWVLVEIGKGYA